MFFATPMLCMAACVPAEKDFSRTEAQQASSAPAAAAPSLEPSLRLARRKGPAPEVSDALPGTSLAHQQLSQQAPAELQEALFARASALPEVRVAPSGISVKGARAFWLKQEVARGPREAFQVGTEFAHIHPAYDGSLHMKLPPDLAEKVFRQGWGVPHPRSGTPLVYGPRDPAELDVIWQLLLRSYEWARDGKTVAVVVE